ncbi:uncharacterized protein LOC102614094 isoform X7 [Citrus sinensis]|uniref:uncharacterized protein LOC102614094 isoform X7 n=1 Tax=Citrus sinensis TaxID=2711 RepID=UPI0022774D0D|nr:uncharacterized protein LOC102614094 isoform X7 [Citrus sinensis]
MLLVMKELKAVIHFVCSVEFWRMALLWPVSLLTSHFQLLFQNLFPRKSNPYKRCVPPITGIKRPVCIVTGATSGLGAAAAYALSREGFHVVLVGRSSHLLSETMADITSRNKDACLEAFQVDLSSFQSVLKFKDSLQQWLLDSDMHLSIQLLINNAGILATSSRLTPEGYDQAADPGVVKTNIMREVPSFLSLMAFTVLKLLGLLQSPEKGINSVLDAALAPPETSGVYFFGGKGRTVNSSALSFNSKLAGELWTTSCNLFINSQLACRDLSN